MEDALLKVEDLRVSFHTYAGEVRAVRGVSFELREGETLAFVGESGCGKTVTAKAVMRLLIPPMAEIKDTSRILYQGADVMKMKAKELQKYRGNEVSMIFQDPMSSLNPTMTCGKQIMESLIKHRGLSKKDARLEAIRMMEMVKIPDPSRRIDDYPHQMSGGMRQRVMIAMALACSPKILIADEPTTALDVTIQAQIMHLLEDLKEKLGMAVILVSHDLGVVANCADRIQVMYAGQVVERGSTGDILYHAEHPYTWALLNAVPKVTGKSKEKLFTLNGTPPDLILPLNRCPFAERCVHCMRICTQIPPEETEISGIHRTSCWLRHEFAPKVSR